MIFIVPLIIIIAFIVYECKLSQNGTFHSCKLSKQNLYGLLFILPAVHLIMAFFYTYIVNEYDYEYPTLGLFLIAISVICLLVSIFALNKRTIPVIIWVVYTVVVTLSCVITFWYNFCMYLVPEELETSDILPYLFEKDYETEEYFIQILIASVVILQFFYIRWLYFYYDLGSPYEQKAVTIEAKTVQEKPVVRPEKKEPIQESSSVGLKSKAESLYEIKNMLDSGILTQEEYDIEKGKILNS